MFHKAPPTNSPFPPPREKRSRPDAALAAPTPTGAGRKKSGKKNFFGRKASVSSPAVDRLASGTLPPAVRFSALPSTQFSLVKPLLATQDSDALFPLRGQVTQTSFTATLQQVIQDIQNLGADDQNKPLAPEILQKLIEAGREASLPVEKILDFLVTSAKNQNKIGAHYWAFQQLLAGIVAPSFVEKIHAHSSQKAGDDAMNYMTIWCQRHSDAAVVYNTDKVERREGIVTSALSDFSISSNLKTITDEYVALQGGDQLTRQQQGKASVRIFNQTIEMIEDQFLNEFQFATPLSDPTGFVTQTMQIRAKPMVSQVLGGGADELLDSMKSKAFKFFNAMLTGVPFEYQTCPFHALLARVVDADIPLIKRALGAKNIHIADEVFKDFLIAQLARAFTKEFDARFQKKVGGMDFLKMQTLTVYTEKSKRLTDITHSYAEKHRVIWADGGLYLEGADQASATPPLDDEDHYFIEPMDTRV